MYLMNKATGECFEFDKTGEGYVLQNSHGRKVLKNTDSNFKKEIANVKTYTMISEEKFYEWNIKNKKK